VKKLLFLGADDAILKLQMVSGKEYDKKDIMPLSIYMEGWRYSIQPFKNSTTRHFMDL